MKITRWRNATRWHRAGRWSWRVRYGGGEFCLGLGVRYDMLPDAWVVTFLCFALAIGRRYDAIRKIET